MADIVRLFDSAINAAQDRLKRRGQIGRINSSGSPTVEVPGSGGRLVYVRLGAGGSDGTIEAVPRGIPKRAHVYVRVRREDKQWVAELDTSAINQNGTGSAGVAPHTHRRNSGNEYVAEAELFAPGVVLPSSGLTVSIGSFRYPNSANGETYPGGTIDLTSHVPATAGKWRWVVVGIDPDTNAAVAVSGSDFDTQAELTLAEIDNVTFTGDIPLAAIQVANGDTALTDHSRYYDARPWFVPADYTGDFLLLAGRSGGQTGYGGTGDGDALTLAGSSHANGGPLLLQPNGGNIGIGKTPAQLVDIQLDQNAFTQVAITNASSGNAARAALLLANDVASGSLAAYSSTYAAEPNWQNSIVLGASASLDGGFVLYSTDKVRIQNSGGVDSFIVTGTNIGINTSNQFGSGTGVIGIANRTVAPTTTPSGGGILYAQAGALRWRGGSGTDTEIAPA